VSQLKKAHKKIPVGLRSTGIFSCKNAGWEMFDDQIVVHYFTGTFLIAQPRRHFSTIQLLTMLLRINPGLIRNKECCIEVIQPRFMQMMQQQQTFLQRDQTLYS
jgi:hypothetical protein